MKALALLGALAVCFAVAGLGSKATLPALAPWYASLRKPRWTPPSWLFGPAWTVLFVLMAVSAWLVWLRVGFSGAPLAFTLFALQLALNVGWSMLFFGRRDPGAAFVEIVLFWLAIAATTYAFGRVDVLAGVLLLPYLAWVSFAAVLNVSIWRLNI